MNDDFFDDTKSLRRSMFICQNERVDHIMKMKMKRMAWSRRRHHLTSTNFYGFSIFDACPADIQALSNSDVLEHIALYLTDTDLFNCRLVCKFWCAEMAYFLSNRKSLVVIDNTCPTAEELLKKRMDGQPISLSKLGFFDVGSNCPLFRKLFQVFGWTLSIVNLEGCNLSPYDLKQMLYVHAPNIENLHFREEYFGNKKPSTNGCVFQQIKLMNDGNITLPKMKVLHWDEKNGRTELKDFIEACPNLMAIELRNFPLPRSSAYKNLNWDSLRSMFLSPKNVLGNEHCKALTYLNLKLKNLTLFGLNSHDQRTMRSLSRFLSTLSNTLQSLELWLDYESVLSYQGHVNYSPLTILLPKVTKLHTESEVLGHVNNLRKLPSISELEIVSNHHEQQNWNSLTKRATVAPPSNNLRFFRCGEIDLKSLDRVMKVFPCITSLNLYASHVDDKLLRSIYLNLNLLMELTISPCLQTHVLPVTDSGITGLSADKCVKLQRNPKKYSDEEVLAWKSQADIGKLQLLQTLDLSFQLSTTISDVSVLFGIARLTKLKTLKMPACRVTDISLSVIEEKLTHLVVLGIAGCKQLSSDAIANFKKKRRTILLDLDLPEMLEHYV